MIYPRNLSNHQNRLIRPFKKGVKVKKTGAEALNTFLVLLRGSDRDHYSCNFQRECRNTTPHSRARDFRRLRQLSTDGARALSYPVPFHNHRYGLNRRIEYTDRLLALDACIMACSHCSGHGDVDNCGENAQFSTCTTVKLKHLLSFKALPRPGVVLSSHPSLDSIRIELSVHRR